VHSVLPHTRQVILVAHDEKFGCRAPHVVTRLNDVDVLITNGDPKDRFHDPSVLAGIRIICVN